VESDDPQSWVTKSPDGSVQALVWDYSPVVPPAGQVDQTFYKQKLPATDKGSLQLDLSHVPDGDYTLSVYQIGYKQNDAYTAYQEMGAPNQLTRDQVRTLNAASAGAPISQTKVTVTSGRFSKTVPLRSNDVFLFMLKPIGR